LPGSEKSGRRRKRMAGRTGPVPDATSAVFASGKALPKAGSNLISGGLKA
jgi:hypothetical protein